MMQNLKPKPETSPDLSAGDTLGKELKRICVDAGGYPDAWPRHTACPACTTKALVPSFSKMGFSHSRCTSCHFVCVNPYPTDAVIKALYEGEYYTKIRLLYEQPLLRKSGVSTPFTAPVDDLKDVIERASKENAKGSWLDVGGGLGAFAALVRERLPGWNVGLNELNKASIAVAQELFDFEIVTSSAAELKAEKKQYDVISSVAVAEHIPDPLTFLQSYFDLLKPGGCLVTVIPHFSKLNIFVSKGSSANVAPPYHTSLFNEEAFRRMLARLDGLETCEIDQVGPPAFELTQVADYGDHWDISIPTEENPVPVSLQIKPYDEETGQKIAALSAVGAHLNDEFAKLDGQQLLVGYCWRSHKPTAASIREALEQEALAAQAKIDAEHKAFVLRQQEEMRIATRAAAAEEARVKAEHEAYVRKQEEETRLAVEAAAAEEARMKAEHEAYVRKQEEETRLAVEAAAAEEARIKAAHAVFVAQQETETRLAAEAAAVEQAKIEAEHKAFVHKQEEETRLAVAASAAEEIRVKAAHVAFVAQQEKEARLAAKAAAVEQARIEAEHKAFVHKQEEEARLALAAAAAEQARIEAEHEAYVRKQQEETRRAIAEAAAEQARIDAEHKAFVERQLKEMQAPEGAAQQKPKTDKKKKE